MASNVNRRSALFGSAALIATTALAWLGFKGPWGERRAQSVPGTGVATTAWADGLPANTKSFLLSWDSVVSQVEAGSPPPSASPSLAMPFNAVAGLIRSIMEQPGNAVLKRRIAFYVSAAGRACYLPYLLPALNPTVSDPKTRSSIVGALHQLAVTHGPAVFTSEARALLVAAYNTTSDSYTQGRLDSLLTQIQEPH